jgi:putative DNA primase/helicase
MPETTIHKPARDDADALVEIEQRILGWVLYDAPGAVSAFNDCRDLAAGFIPPHDRIAAAIFAALENGTNCTPPAIALAMKGDAGLDEIGGFEYLRQIAFAAPAVAHKVDCERQFSAAVHTYRTAIARLTIAAHARDAVDALACGSPDALQQLSALGAEAREVEAKSKLRLPLSISADDFLSKAIPPRRKLLSPWLPSSGLAMVHAWRGVGKTHFAIGAAVACSTAGAFLKWTAERPCRVLYVDGEMSAADMQARIRAALAAAAPLPDVDYFRLITPDLLPDGAGVPNLQTLDGQAAIEPDLKGRDLVVFDNVATLFRTAEDQNAAGSWLQAQDYILSLRRRGIAVLLVDHDNKSGGNRGTSAKHDVLDTVIQLKEPSDYVSSQGARFEVHFSKHRGFRGRDAASFEAQLMEHAGQAIWTIRDAEDAELDRYAELVAAGLKDRDIRDEMGIGGSRLARLKSTLKSGSEK